MSDSWKLFFIGVAGVAVASIPAYICYASVYRRKQKKATEEFINKNK